MRAASIERIFPPGLPLFNSAQTKKIYRPVLYRLDLMPSDIQGFKLIFIEIPNEEDPRPVGALGTISKLLTMARKFHWGIIEKYRSQLQGLVDKKESEEKINECLEAVDSALAKIESESVNLGFFNPECITPAFSGQGDKEKIKEIAEIWPDLRKALSDKNLENLINIMDKMRKMTKGFLIIASQNYHDLLKQMDD
ncbi:unnamed protein product [marine sediment metagenome]|uniref:Uncharacterized protein n=1 Tax=marine sediment metagenome TaxID=412755 RepID=X1BNG5_9ZZZZ